MSKAQNSKSKQTSGSECKHIREYINQKQSGTDAIKTLKENSTVEKIVNNKSLFCVTQKLIKENIVCIKSKLDVYKQKILIQWVSIGKGQKNTVV